MPQPGENEVVVNNAGNQKVFGPNTVIQINLKTLVVALGLIISGLSTAYYSLSSKIEKSNEKTTKDIEVVSNKLEKIKDEDLSPLKDQVNYIRGQLGNVVNENQNELRQTNRINRANESVNVENQNPTLPR